MASLTEAQFSQEDAEEMVMCARYGELEDMVAYLDAGIPVSFGNDFENTALHMAAANGHAPCAKALVERGAVDQPNSDGNFALHWAVQNQHLEVVKTLLTSPKADILKKNSFGKSPLTEAFGRKNADITAALLTHSSAKELEKSKAAKGQVESKAEKQTTGAKESPATPLESKVIQEKTHSFSFGSAGGPMVKCRELALNWDGAAFHDNVAEHDVTGINIWSASIVLSRWLISHPEWVNDKDVCELGAGCGLPGLTAGVVGKPKSILLTDYLPHCVENLSHNLKANNISEGGAHALDWNRTATWPKGSGSSESGKKFGVLLGSDLVYDLEMVPALISVVSGLMESDGTFLYVAPKKRDGLTEFLQAMTESDFEVASTVEAPEAYYENPLADATETECDIHFNELSSKKYTLYKFIRRSSE